MLLYFLIPCFSLIFFSKSLPWKTEQLPFLTIIRSIKKSLLLQIQPRMSFMKIPSNPKAERFTEPGSKVSTIEKVSVLDLPELVLECILEKLPPSGLCTMAGVCSSLRERCVSDHLWEKHMKQKWGKIIGPAVYREWQWFIAFRNDSGNPKQGKPKGFCKILSFIRNFSWVVLRFKDGVGVDDDCGRNKQTGSASLPVDSVMNMYHALESGRFWFPAQVYNRENGHVGFVLSCYDAELSYDPHTDTFQARYPPHGRRAVAIEQGIPWERLRAPPMDTCPHDLHVSDCLNDLKPGNHIEIQWRRNKEFPYGWWYGVVGHLESCDGTQTRCDCHQNNTVVLEFNHYTPGSRWRRTVVNRKDHREVGNEADGFYGGIRKLNNQEEIATWKQLWPTLILE